MPPSNRTRPIFKTVVNIRYSHTTDPICVNSDRKRAQSKELVKPRGACSLGGSLPERKWSRSRVSSRRSRFCVLSCSGCYVDGNSGKGPKRSSSKVAHFADGDCCVPRRSRAAGNGPRSRWAFRRKLRRPLSDLPRHALRGSVPDHSRRNGIDPNRNTRARAA